MKTKELFEICRTDPVNGVGSTSRLRLCHGVLYYKDDSGMFFPMFAFMGDYLLNFINCSPWNLGASTRTRNMVDSPINQCRIHWAKLTGSFDGEFMDDQPAVVVNDRTDSSLLGILKPGPTTAKMLAMGIHPESGKTRQDMMSYSQKESLGDGDLRLAFHKAFEEQVRWLAFGAIRRENSLRDMANIIGQMKLECDQRANDVVGEMSKRAENHFAPEDLSSAGMPDTHLKPLATLMDQFGKLSGKLHNATRCYSEVALASDSLIPRVNTDTWEGVKWNNKVGFTEPGTYTDRDTVTKRGFATGNVPLFQLHTPTINFVDHNARSLSYYWVRRNMGHYKSILGRLNFVVPNLFDQAPEEWEYTELAAPLFATTDQK